MAMLFESILISSRRYGTITRKKNQKMKNRKQSVFMKLSMMKNIGAELERKLGSIGIKDAEGLAAAGSKEAFLRLKAAYPEVCLVHLYALQGAIDDVKFNNLPSTVKKELKQFSDSL